MSDPPDVGRLVDAALATGDPVGWFEPLYVAARGEPGAVPWERGGPHPLLLEGLDRLDLAPASGDRAVVVGCGLGGDAEEVADRGWDVTAFDVAPTAVSWARELHPDSPVDYRVADLHDLPAAWRGAFDLVVEVYTLQSLPAEVRGRAAAAVASLVAPAGWLLVVALGAPRGERLAGPPWPLTPGDLSGLTRAGLHRARFWAYREEPDAAVEQWVAAYRRPVA